MHFRAISGWADRIGDANTTFLWEPREQVEVEAGDIAKGALGAVTSSLAVRGRGCYGFELTNPTAATSGKRPAAANVVVAGE